MTLPSDTTQIETSLANDVQGSLMETSANGDVLSEWARFFDRRKEVASLLSELGELLSSAEVAGAEESGQLSLTDSIHGIQRAADNLRTGTYRLMVMGDMKRGKSTLLNALIGENLLPSDVNPCTALLTVLRYGSKKQITLHFKESEKAPETISLETFKADYTIDPAESKRLAAQGQEAFPHIAQVVVEYPLPWLQQGIELVDTPGLNDTEARNDQVLSYLSDAQAVLFVLDATQPLTLDEQRYLKNYLKESGLSLFFIVNGWDRIQANLIDPEDSAALAEAEAKVREVFSRNLRDFAQSERMLDGELASDLRVFEVSALQALRSRLRGQPLTDSGLERFLGALDHFLAYERGPAELKRAVSVASRAYRSVSTSVSRRLPLLDETLESLKEKVASVESDFTKLEEIRDRYRKVIHTSRDINAQAVSHSFRDYILSLEGNFESDFAETQPDLEFLDFLEAEKRQEFYSAFKRAFERYINDRLAVWEFTAKQTIGKAFDELNENAAEYQVAYAEVVEVIHEKLMGRRFHAVGHDFDPKKAKVWVDSVKDVFEDIPDNLNNAVRPFNGFWQSVMQSALAYICIVIALQLLGIIFSSLFLNVVGVIMAAGGIFAVQAEFVRQEFLKATKKEFAKQLPRIADEQTPNIHRAVKECFTAYEKRAIDRISNDIDSRKGELSNLVAQKQLHEINRDREIERLQQLERRVQENVSAIEAIVVAEG